MKAGGLASPARRRLLAAAPVLFGGGLFASNAAAARVTLPLAASLQAEMEAASAKGRALIVLVSLQACPFCTLVRDGYLGSLREQGQPVVQLDMRSPRALADFNGTATTHDQIVKSLRVRVAPTVLFFGRHGREAAERLVGVSIPDFYGAYLQERVDAANRTFAG